MQRNRPLKLLPVLDTPAPTANRSTFQFSENLLSRVLVSLAGPDNDTPATSNNGHDERSPCGLVV